MGKSKYIAEIENFIKKSPVVNAKSIIRIINSKKRTKQYQKLLLKRLVDSGKIKRITKGYYTIHDNVLLTVFCFTPAYLGLQEALSFHNLWEQETIPVIITPKKVRQGIRRVFNTNVMIRRIDRRYFLGIEYKKEGNFYFPYSDLEKTFIDMVYFNQLINKETISNIKRLYDRKKLLRYLKMYPKRFKDRVLYLIE